MKFEYFEKLKLIEACEINIRSYKNMSVEALSPSFKAEMMHEVESWETIKEKIEGEM